MAAHRWEVDPIRYDAIVSSCFLCPKWSTRDSRGVNKAPHGPQFGPLPRKTLAPPVAGEEECWESAEDVRKPWNGIFAGPI